MATSTHKQNLLSAERLRYLLDYDPADGIFRWKNPNKGKARPGQIVTGWSVGKGYLAVGLDERRYTLHRLAWLYVYGRWPNGDIDHINCVKTDNRIANLRECSKSQNAANTRGRSSSGYKGVYPEKRTGKFFSLICINRRRINLGTFTTAEEAHEAYKSAAGRLFGQFARAE